MWTWYVSRAAGLVSLVLLTATVLLGIAGVTGAEAARWPRFAVAGLHRNLSLAAVGFVALHVVTAVADGYVPISWTDVVVPFAGAWQPFWLGLGATAFDLLAILVVTGLLRTRIPRRAWRAVHLSAYAFWPLTLAHGLGIGGADSTTGWILVLTLGCATAVAAGVVWRVGVGAAGRDAAVDGTVGGARGPVRR